MTIHFLAPEDKDKWNPIWHKCFDTWAQTKYNINVWTDEGIDNLLKEDDEEFYTNYLSKLPNIYKFDYVRYIILEKYGGAYFDMDVELVDESFFNKLNPNKLYIKEGHAGSYMENSIIISLSSSFSSLWKRLKNYTKNMLRDNFENAKLSPNYTLTLVGPDIMGKFFSTHVREKDILHNTISFEILSHEHFGSLTNEISFTRHHMTNSWQ